MKRLLILLVLIISCNRKEENWELLYSEYKKFPEKLNLKTVLASGEEALEKTRVDYGNRDIRYIVILEQLVDIIDTCSIYNDNKEKYYSELINCRKDLLYKEFNEVNIQNYLSSLHGLATFYYDLKKYKLSLELFFRKVDIINTYYVDSLSYLNESNLLNTYYHIGLVFQEQHKLPEAEIYYSKSYELVKKRIENSHCHAQMEALIINSLYKNLLMQLKYKEAEIMLIDIIKIAEKFCGRKSIMYFGNLLTLKDFYDLTNKAKAASIENELSSIRDSVQVLDLK